MEVVPDFYIAGAISEEDTNPSPDGNYMNNQSEPTYLINFDISDFLDDPLYTFNYHKRSFLSCFPLSISNKLYQLKHHQNLNREHLEILLGRLEGVGLKVDIEKSTTNLIDLCILIYCIRMNQDMYGPIGDSAVWELYAGIGELSDYFIRNSGKILSASTRWKKSNHSLRPIVCILSGVVKRMNQNEDIKEIDFRKNPDDYWADLESYNNGYA